jgi:hypothetical protein
MSRRLLVAGWLDQNFRRDAWLIIQAPDHVDREAPLAIENFRDAGTRSDHTTARSRTGFNSVAMAWFLGIEFVALRDDPFEHSLYG